MAEAADDVVYPIAFTTFAASLRKTEDEVWTKLLARAHGREAQTPAGWHQLLTALKAGAAPASVPPTSASVATPDAAAVHAAVEAAVDAAVAAVEPHVSETN